MPRIRRLPLIEWSVERFITHQRDRWHAQALPLSPNLRSKLSAYFPSQDLNRIRLAENVRLPVPRRTIAAITFDHVVLARQPVWPSLIFHELVHVTQFRLLGVKLFSQQYVRGFLANLSYEAIPLEACAFDLEARFIHASTPFDVEAEVRRHLNNEKA